MRTLLFPNLDEDSSREEKIDRIKELVHDDTYITDEKLDEAISQIIDEIGKD